MNTSPNTEDEAVKAQPPAAPARYDVGDAVKTRKPHPCGSDIWDILRVGADIRLKCRKCGRMFMLPRSKFDKMIKAVIKSE